MSKMSGGFQKRRGVRSGLPDVLVIANEKPIFVELKSRGGVPSKAQKQVGAELKLAGACSRLLSLRAFPAPNFWPKADVLYRPRTESSSPTVRNLRET
jgi:hypothetical protein